MSQRGKAKWDPEKDEYVFTPRDDNERDRMIEDDKKSVSREIAYIKQVMLAEKERQRQQR